MAARWVARTRTFNGYLKGSFVVPLAASIEAAGLRLDVELA